MIKIKRTLPCPVVQDRQRNCKLTSETLANNALYARNPASYDNGTSKFIFNSDIYGDGNIKTALIKMQFGKCAFCENNVTAVAYGDVEHFRPKKGYQQNEKDSLHYAGYYWLAYNWENLLFSCAICNQRHKKNLFPLLNPHSRALNHLQSINREKPVFIDPSKENPRNLIRFVGSTAKGIDKKNRGKKTIEAIGLNRTSKNGISNLFEERNDYFDLIKITYDTSKKVAGPQITQIEIDNAKQLMKKFLKKNKKFSAMLQDNFSI